MCGSAFSLMCWHSFSRRKFLASNLLPGDAAGGGGGGGEDDDGGVNNSRNSSYKTELPAIASTKTMIQRASYESGKERGSHMEARLLMYDTYFSYTKTLRSVPRKNKNRTGPRSIHTARGHEYIPKRTNN